MQRESPRIGCVATVGGLCWGSAAVLWGTVWIRSRDSSGGFDEWVNIGFMAFVGSLLFLTGFIPSLMAICAYFIRDEPRHAESQPSENGDSEST